MTPVSTVSLVFLTTKTAASVVQFGCADSREIVFTNFTNGLAQSSDEPDNANVRPTLAPAFGRAVLTDLT